MCFYLLWHVQLSVLNRSIPFLLSCLQNRTLNAYLGDTTATLMPGTTTVTTSNTVSVNIAVSITPCCVLMNGASTTISRGGSFTFVVTLPVWVDNTTLPDW